MAGIKLETIALLVIAGVVLMNFTGNGQTNADGTPTQTTIDFGAVVEPSAVFTGQRMFLSGTSLTAEAVRVLKENGGVLKDLGLTSLNSGSLNTAAGAIYRVYYGENSSLYYTAVEKYTAPVQDAPDDKVGVLCRQTQPTITVFDEFDNVQSSTANAQAITTDDEKDVKVRVRAAVDSCYGAPDASMDNALCFLYNTTPIKSVEANTGKQITPYLISSNRVDEAGETVSCYKLPKLQDNAFIDIPVKVKSTSTEPTNSHNISIYTNDVDFDLDADTLAEIEGFEDEDNNELGLVETQNATLYIS